MRDKLAIGMDIIEKSWIFLKCPNLVSSNLIKNCMCFLFLFLFFIFLYFSVLKKLFHMFITFESFATGAFSQKNIKHVRIWNGNELCTLTWATVSCSHFKTQGFEQPIGVHEKRQFQLTGNQLIHLDMIFLCSTAFISPANFTAFQMIYNHVKFQP